MGSVGWNGARVRDRKSARQADTGQGGTNKADYSLHVFSVFDGAANSPDRNALGSPTSR
jgi:hypothetical protein